MSDDESRAPGEPQDESTRYRLRVVDPSDRTPPPPPRVIGRARLLPGQAQHSPGLDPATWYQVFDGNPAVTTPPLPGWMWIELHGKPRNAWAAHFELRAPEGPG